TGAGKFKKRSFKSEPFWISKVNFSIWYFRKVHEVVPVDNFLCSKFFAVVGHIDCFFCWVCFVFSRTNRNTESTTSTVFARNLEGNLSPFFCLWLDFCNKEAFWGFC